MNSLINQFLQIFNKKPKVIYDATPYYLREEWKTYMVKLKTRLYERVEKDLEQDNIRQAIDWCGGFLSQFPNEQDVHYKLAQLCLSANDKIQAGKHFYFKENPSTEEQECITAFENRYGFDDTIILKKFMPKENFKISACDDRIKELIKTKIDAIEKEKGFTPKFLLSARNHLNKKAPVKPGLL